MIVVYKIDWPPSHLMQDFDLTIQSLWSFSVSSDWKARVARYLDGPSPSPLAYLLPYYTEIKCELSVRSFHLSTKASARRSFWVPQKADLVRRMIVKQPPGAHVQLRSWRLLWQCYHGYILHILPAIAQCLSSYHGNEDMAISDISLDSGRFAIGSWRICHLDIIALRIPSF